MSIARELFDRIVEDYKRQLYFNLSEYDGCSNPPDFAEEYTKLEELNAFNEISLALLELELEKARE